MKKRWYNERKYLQDDTRRQEKAEGRKDIRWFADRGDEKGFVSYMKMRDPEISEEKLKEFVRLFRDYVADRERRHLT